MTWVQCLGPTRWKQAKGESRDWLGRVLHSPAGHSRLLGSPPRNPPAPPKPPDHQGATLPHRCLNSFNLTSSQGYNLVKYFWGLNTIHNKVIKCKLSVVFFFNNFKITLPLLLLCLSFPGNSWTFLNIPHSCGHSRPAWRKLSWISRTAVATAGHSLAWEVESSFNFVFYFFLIHFFFSFYLSWCRTPHCQTSPSHPKKPKSSHVLNKQVQFTFTQKET